MKHQCQTLITSNARWNTVEILHLKQTTDKKFFKYDNRSISACILLYCISSYDGRILDIAGGRMFLGDALWWVKSSFKTNNIEEIL